ncbi:ubiquinone/menaquinone biosynthesis C-methylase UbiE [Paenibacillus sp. V4I3]|uniref:class I SAM-dependent methyltransferase n=1 Tax=unclassified Paenibacillus TaxID=185978 RepID=UPI00277D6B36|nr:MULTISPECIES: class I SAM-dependent methyltransferase [unclassified Paenibacillus]MDQ0875585.1 ubiquinone/menaquinone biosynthesis C-methylase UbiE [Paenibacillus sp. V4I3]MDQ0888334.1 ubiquinone/menaquinone biosynthesis C-methylase UbiE [Paenibacillus sp. V4I9]
MSRDNNIYQDNTETYDLLISKQPNLAKVIHEIRPYEHLDVVDLGAGTGRLSMFLAADANSLWCLDSSKAMLSVLEKKLTTLSSKTNWRTIISDHRALPIEDASKDLVVAGWSLCYLASSNNEGWEYNLKQMMSEIRRILRPDGTVIILETLGTGFVEPTRYDYLAPYYQLLETEYGFEHTSLATDYKFKDVNEAAQLTSYFFGEDFGNQVRANNWHVVPEYAGIWYKHFNY